MNWKKKILFLIIPVLGIAQTDPIQWQKHIISDTLTGAKKIAVANVDRDAGRNMDVVVTSNPEADGPEDSAKPNVIWFKNLGAQQFERHVVDFLLTGARGLAVGDLTGDGYPEIVAGSRADTSRLYWYLNDGTPDNGPWVRTAVGGRAPNRYAISIVDLDQDGYVDIVDGFGDDANNRSANSGVVTDSVRFLRNTGRSDTLIFDPRLVVQISSPAGIAVGKFDQDNDFDVAVLSWVDYVSLIPQQGETLKWWAQQVDTSFVEQQELLDYYGGNDLKAVDLDGNGTLDIVAAGYKTGTLDWWQNDGNGLFSNRTIIDLNLVNPRHLAVGDFDGDADVDIALTVDEANTVYWYENDGSQNFTRHAVDTLFTYAYFVCSSDLDGDGDLDLLGTAQDAAQLAWWENNLAEEQSVASGSPDTVIFYQGKVKIKYDSPYPGGLTSVFFNQGENHDTLSLNAGLEKIAKSGFYTIVSHAVSYSATLVFRYDSLPQWQNLSSDESLLRICFWNDSDAVNTKWEIAGSPDQLVDTVKNTITVFGINTELHKYSNFTLGVATGPSFAGRTRPEFRPGTVKHFNYPNPFNSQTWIQFNIPEQGITYSADVRVNVFNMLGQKIRTLFEGELTPGTYRLLWNGKNEQGHSVSSGWYFYRLKMGKREFSGRLLLIR
ncbi:MAG: T9SS type A sorting domain-containing protein [Calditrichaeota bacterium]|nr:T9SS type A sorting domain-containing protein [Calditrichota bacterium]